MKDTSMCSPKIRKHSNSPNLACTYKLSKPTNYTEAQIDRVDDSHPALPLVRNTRCRQSNLFRPILGETGPMAKITSRCLVLRK